MDYAFVHGSGTVFDYIRTMLDRRVPATTTRTAKHVRQFVEDLNLDGALHPASDLVIGAHANSEGQWFVLLFDSQVNGVGRPATFTSYEHLEQSMAAGALTKRIRIDNSLVGFTTPPPTHSVRLIGCNLGKAAPFVAKLKEALGGNVLVAAALHFYGVATSVKGSFEYMCYEFSVQTPATPRAGGAVGFVDRAALLAAFNGVGFRYLFPTPAGTPVPAIDWDTKFVPKDIRTSQSFYVAMPLGRTLNGLKAITIKPDPKKGAKGAREFRANVIETQWVFTPSPAATNHVARVSELKAKIAQDSRFAVGHAWPVFKRGGYNTLDEFMDGHHWDFGAGNQGPVATGKRVEYTVLFPITNGAGNLVYNFYPVPGTPSAAITDGFSSIGLDHFFLTV